MSYCKGEHFVALYVADSGFHVEIEGGRARLGDSPRGSRIRLALDLVHAAWSVAHGELVEADFGGVGTVEVRCVFLRTGQLRAAVDHVDATLRRQLGDRAGNRPRDCPSCSLAVPCTRTVQVPMAMTAGSGGAHCRFHQCPWPVPPVLVPLPEPPVLVLLPSHRCWCCCPWRPCSCHCPRR